MTLSPEDIEEEIHYTHRYFASDRFVSKEPDVEAVFEQLLQDFKDMAKRARPLGPTERAIMTLTRPKTAALLADRVWTVSDADPSIAFGWALPMEIRFRALIAIINYFELAHSGPTSTEPESELLSLPGIERVESFFGKVERDMARGFHEATGATVLPLYSSLSRRDAQYHSGDQAALICIVDNLQIVDEEQLTWEQIAEFRRDNEARAAYRRFIHWLDRDMIDKSVQYIADEVAQRLERYEWSLHKHGIKTLIGSLNNILNPTSLVATSTAALAANLIAGKPIWSLLAASGLLIGQAALSTATTLVERRDIEMAHSEVAYVQQLKTSLCIAE